MVSLANCVRLAVLLSSCFLERRVIGESNVTVTPSSTTPISSSQASSTTTPSSSSSSTTTSLSSSKTASGSTSAPMTTTLTTAITPTPTSSVVTSSTASSETFETRLNVMATIEGECTSNTSKTVNDWVRDPVYKDGYGIKDVITYTSSKADNKCTLNITIFFNKGLGKTDIREKINNASKNGINGKTLTIDSMDVHVDGVTLGKEYTVNGDDCKKKCCGTGGPIDVKRTCEPTNKCVNYNLTKTENDCTPLCKDHCSAGVATQVSLMVITIGWLSQLFLNM